MFSFKVIFSLFILGFVSACAVGKSEDFHPERWIGEFFAAKIAGGGRYLERNCQSAPAAFFEHAEYRRYKGHNVLRCVYPYSSGGIDRTGLVYLLNPSAADLSQWVGHACRKQSLVGKDKCLENLAKYIWHQNNAQFPIAGIVLEKSSSAGGSGSAPMNLEFRHGVTVRTTERFNGTKQQLTIGEMERSAFAEVACVRRWARVAGAERFDYVAMTGDASVLDGGECDVDWAEISARSYLEALGKSSYALLDAVATRRANALAK